MMARTSLLAVNLAALTLALSLWLFHVDGERPPSPDGAPATILTSSSPATSPVQWVAQQPWPLIQEPPRNDSYCLTCHGDPSFRTRFADGRSLSLYVDARELRDSAHALSTCVTCHDDREVCPPDRTEPLDFATYWTEAAEMCIRCHLAAAGEYARDVHGRPIFSGTGEGARCNDCHSPELSGHTTAAVSDSRSQLGPQSVDENCGRCHAQELTTYRQTSHSKVVRFGDPQRSATCITCHSDHAVTAVDDPMEPLTAASLVTVCRGCHDGADEGFAGEWLGHEASPSRSASLYYAERFPVLLIAAGLGFALAHMTLDLVRRLADCRRRRRGSPR